MGRPFFISSTHFCMPRSLILVGLLLVAAWLTPNHYPPWLASHSEAMAAIAVCLLLVTASFSRVNLDISLPGLSRPAVLLGLLALVPLVQWCFGLVAFFGDAWISFLYVLTAALVVQAAFALQHRLPDKSVDLLAVALFAGALVTALIIFLQRSGQTIGQFQLFVVDVPPGRAPTGNMAQPNQSATLIALGLVGLAYLYERQWVRTAPAAAIAIVLIAAQSATLSRAQGLLWVVAFSVCVLVRKRAGLKLRPELLACGALLWVLLYFLWTLVPFPGDLPADKGLLSARMQAGPRVTIWQQLASAVLEKPVFGWGWAQVSNAQFALAEAFPDSRMTESAHNILLDLILWNGLLVALLLLFFAVIWLGQVTKRVSDPSGTFCLMLVFLLLSHSLVEYPLSYLYYLVPFAIAVGVLERTRDPLGLDSSFKYVGSWGLRVWSIVAPAILVVSVADYWRVESSFREMRFAVARIGQTSVAYEHMGFTAFDQLEARHRLPLITPVRAMPAGTLEWYLKVVQRYPIPLFLHNYAVVQVLNGDSSGAERTLTILRNLHGLNRFLESCRELKRLSEGESPEMATISCVSRLD